MSYSHAFDSTLARQFQLDVERFGRRWYRPRARRVFRDVTNLAAAPSLWSSIEAALAVSRWFVLFASPPAADSVWVRREVEWWLKHHGTDRILIALTEGSLPWVCPGTSPGAALAVPPVLVEAFGDQPRWVDLRAVPGRDRRAPADPAYREAVVDVAACISGVAKDELSGEHVRQRKLQRRWRNGIVSALTTLAVATSVISVIAVQQRNDAREQTLSATSRLLVAQATSVQDTQPDLARQLMVQAYRMARTERAVGAVLSGSSIPRTIHTQGFARAVAFSPARRLLAVASDAGADLFDSGSLRRLAHVPDVTKGVVSLAFTADDRSLVLGANGWIGVVDITSARRPVLSSTVTIGSGSIGSLAYGHRGPIIAAAVDGGVSLVDLRNRTSPRVIHVIKGAGASGLWSNLAVSRDGLRLAAPLGDASVGLWDLTDPAAPTPLGTVTVTATSKSLALSPDGRTLVCGGNDGSARVFDVFDPRHPVFRAHLSGQTLGADALAFSPDGQAVAVGAGDSTVQLWDFRDVVRPRAGSLLTGQSSSVASVDFSADGQLLAAATDDGSFEDNVGAVKVWSISGAERGSADSFLPDGNGLPPSVTSSGVLVAQGSPAQLWDIADRDHIAPLAEIPTYSVALSNAVGISGDGRLLATGKPLRVWNSENPSRPTELTPKNDAIPTSGYQQVTFSPSGRIVAANDFGTVDLWDVSRPDRPVLAGSLSSHFPAGGSGGPAFRDKGATIVVIDGSSAVLWDITDPHAPRRLGTATVPQASVTSVAISADGLTLVTGDSAGSVTSWDLHHPAAPVRLASIRRHSTAVESLAYQPRGGLVASAGNDSIRLLDFGKPSRPVEMATLGSGHLYNTSALTFLPDGSTLLASDGRGIQLWTMDVTAMLKKLCLLSRPLTQAEWVQYLPDDRYQPPCR